MRLYLIRHAQSTNNVLEDQRQRVHDPEVTELGQEQMAALTAHLTTQPEMPTGLFGDARHADDQQYRFTHLYCSPMIRALDTARPLAAAFNLTPRVWIDIHEIGGIFLEDEAGQAQGFGGLPRSAMQARFPGYDLPPAITEDGWWPVAQGRETTPDYMCRALKVALALKERAASDDRIVLVSHGAFMDVLIKALLNQLPGRPFDMFFAHYNTAITRFDFADGPDILRLHYLNRIEHLPHHLRSW